MTDYRYWITNGQSVRITFSLSFSFVPKHEVKIKLKLNRDFAESEKSAKLLPGKYYTALTRHAQFSFTVPATAKGMISPLGEFEVTEGGRQIFHDELEHVFVAPNHRYFEKIVVPRDLEELGFFVENIGEANAPDAIAYHKIINPQEKIDVESTLFSEYNAHKWNDDISKFDRYRLTRKLSRLLIVCQSDSVSQDVINWLNKDPRPVTLMEYYDLVALKQEFKNKRDHHTIYAKLTVKGRSTIGSRPSEFSWIPPREFTVPRPIGMPKTR